MNINSKQSSMSNINMPNRPILQQQQKGGYGGQAAAAAGVGKHNKIDSNDTDLLAINRWNKMRTELKVLPAASLRLINPNKESECYKFSPKNVEGLSYQPKSKETKGLAIKFNFSLFSNQAKQFFGRSYLTGAYYLKAEQGGYNFQFEHPFPFSLFFHTQLEKSSATFLVFEAYILEIGNHDIIYNTYSCGVGEINILNLLREPQTISLKNTTMRQYVSNYSQEAKVSNSGVRLLFMFDQYPNFNKIKHLIPESVIISTNDIIPGVADQWSDEKFMESKMLKQEQAIELMMNTLPTFKLYLTQVQIQFRESVEKELVRQVQQFLEVSKSVSNKVIFKEKKLICGFHNGWEFVNRGGSSNRVTLKQGARSTINDEEGHEASIVNLEYSGMHEIDNIFDSDQSVIVLQLEYDIEYVAQARQIATRVIAWLPISISGKLTSQKEISVQEVMLHGPGKSIDGQRMMSLPYREEFDIKVNVSFRTVLPGTNQMNLFEEIQRAKQIQQESIDQSYQQNITKQQNYQYDVRMQETKKQQMMAQQQMQGKQGFVDVQMQMLDQQIMNEKRRLGEMNEQIMQRRQQAFTGGSAQFNPSDEYQIIAWEPRNEQERYLKNLQVQSQIMKDQISSYQRERDQIQLGLTQEYRLMREELVNTRTSQSGSSQNFFKRSLRSSPSKFAKNNYDDNDQDQDEGIEVIEGRELDFNPTKSKITYQGNKENPLIVHLNQPTYGKRELSKKDRIELINSNVPGLLDDIPIMNTKEQHVDEKSILEQDMKDTLKASHIVFRILSFKPNAYQGLPKRMYMTLNFFDFPKYQTESFSYESKDDRSLIMEMIENQTPIIVFREAFLKGEDDKYLCFKFEIDPSKSRYNDLFKDFVSYLIKKQLHVDIWDADTLMLFGSFKVPLSQIRRGGMNRKTTQIDLDIVNTNFIGSRGSIQLSIDNIGKEEQNPNKRKQKEEQENIKQEQNVSVNMWQNKATQKAKIISEKSISIPQNFIKNQKSNAIFNVGGDNKGNVGVKADEQSRKMERVKRFKNTTLNQAALLFEDEDDPKLMQKMQMGLDLSKIKDLSQHRIEQIEEIKNKKKPEFVKSVISKFLNEEKVLSVSYGKQEIVPYLLHNTTASTHTFSIVIEDADADILPAHEFEPISDETEWRYWCQALGHPEPSSYEILQGNTIVLESNEKATILFKFMTYRNIDPQLKDKPDAERIASQRDESYRQKCINPRSINVFFSLKQQTIVGGFRLKVEPHSQVIDHIFRYYEKQNKSISITLPPLYLKNETPQLKPTLHITNNAVQLDWVNDHEIAVFAKMPQVSRITKFNILVYNSDFRSNLLSNIQVELHSLEGVDVHVNMGQSTQFKLNIPGDVPRVIQLYSSQPDILWFMPPYEASFTLPPGKITQVDASVKSLTTISQRIQVNAVDIHSNELVHSWIVRIETDIPKPTKVLELTSAACKESIQVFEYFNKSNKMKNFSFLSSDPTILEMLDPSKQIMGKSGEEIAVKIVARDYETPESQVIVFVSDYEETIFETLKFRVRYIFNEESQSIAAFNKLKKQKDMILKQQSQQAINQSMLSEQDNYYQRSMPNQGTANNFYNDQNATSQSFYQDQYHQPHNNYPNNYDNNKNNNNYGGYQNNNYNGAAAPGGQQNNNYNNNYNNYNNNNNNNNNNQYGNYENYQNQQPRQQKKGGKQHNYEQDNNYQDYGRNQQPRGGNYDAYQGGQQQNYDNYNQQGRKDNKKVSFGEQQQQRNQYYQ